MTPVILRAGNASAWTGPTGNNTYLLPGAVPTLVDAGVGDPAHIDAIDAALGGAALAQVLITHGHSDHVGGLPALEARWPRLMVFRLNVDAAGLGPAAEERLSAGDGHLVAVHTPGHSPDHVCFIDEPAGDIYCGDLARANGTIVIPGSRGGNLRQYLESLKRIRDFRPKRLLPGHGPIITEPLALIAGYLQHRADREAQIIDVVRRQAMTPQEIVPRIYGKLADRIEAAAAESVLAHLIKLEEDGIARRRDDGRWERVKG